MLKPAFLFKDQINALYQERIFTPEFKYLFFGDGSFDFELEIYSNNENHIQMVSLDSQSKVCGFFDACIDRTLYKVESLMVMNLSDNGSTFSFDFARFINSLIHEYRFSKINFSAIVGSPGEKVYDSHLKTFNARIVGVMKNEVRLRDGDLYDLKLYEIPGSCPLNKTLPDVD